ncbi:MAG: S46 family peptidase [Flavobacteriales bacterium]|nr:S46 family peptidase [Flavobacteriales bacterium]
MKKFLSLLAAAWLTAGVAFAGEGMWLLNKIKQVNEADMKRLGFKLTAEDLYDINNSSMKDAIARLGGGFCTGEMVSAEGLMLTNHHCGYDAIQGFSSPQNDYLTLGFWAMKRDEEKNVQGLFVSYLQYIEDVTEKVNKELTEGMSEAKRNEKIEEVGARLEKEAEKAGQYLSADFKVMFEGNEFYLFVYKDYRDVRLVGAPPSAIGKFGGDTDNWMWPRHTGDFTLFRVYTAPNGEPAEYSPDNVPLKPKWHLPISLNGVQKGDFAMIMGFPGSTDRFLSSQGVKLALDVEQPSRVKIRAKKLEIMKEHMDASDTVRIMYAAKYAQVSNYWKYFIGQQRGLKRLRVYDKKKQQEDELMAWVNASTGRQVRFGEITKLLDEGYAERSTYEKSYTYMQEAAFGSEAIRFGFRLLGLKAQLEKDPKDAAKIAAMVAGVQAAADGFWSEYDPATDRDVTAALYRMMAEDLDPAMQPDVLKTVKTKFKGDFNAWAKAMWNTSILTDRKRLAAFLSKPTLKAMDKDLGMQASSSVRDFYRGTLMGGISNAETTIARGYRLMVAAMREKNPDHMWYPNANSTLRMTYGIVNDYKAADAVHYDLVTTANGVLEKMDNTSDEFTVPDRQYELLKARNYGRYADANGELVVCFISENDITGGNSGSPVINGNGELIGVAFDGNWEAMSGDIAYEPELQRTISVDIRYVLWVIDVYANAGHLVKEMTLVQGKREEPKAELPTAPMPKADPAKPAPAKR